MAKVAKTKKREPSTHSRAHRRAASPDAKGLSVKSPGTKTKTEEEYKPWLHNAANAGISKKKKVKPMSSKQKTRQLKAMEKADAVWNKHETKVKDSKKRAGKVEARRAQWEDLNGGLGKKEGQKVEKKKASVVKDGALDLKMTEAKGGEERESDWEDEVVGEDATKAGAEADQSDEEL